MKSKIQTSIIIKLVILICCNCYGQSNLAMDELTGKKIRVTLIGTGVPPVDAKRMGASVLVEVAEKKYLFDAGRGASINLVKHGLELADISAIFFTHLHADHVLGLPDLWLSSYHKTNGHRQEPLTVYGPIGINQMTSGLKSAYKDIFEMWELTDSYADFNVKKIISEGEVLNENGISIIAFRVNHGKREAFGFRINYQSNSVVISGDTGYSENLIKYSKGVDLIIHEVFHETRVLNEDWLGRLKGIHTLPDEAAKVFNQVNPKVAVGYHLGASSKDLNNIMEKLYSGEFHAGEDLMSFEIEDEVKIIKK